MIARRTLLAGAWQRRRRPNFILITCDDLGYADIGAYRDGIDYTPHLDRLAREGTRFTSFYATPVCTPSRAALMTGCYSKRVGLDVGSWHAVLMPGDWHGLNPSEITVARLLQQDGYATKCVGKWHLGDQPEFLPTRHGFDSYFGIPYSNDMNPKAPVKPPLYEHPHPPLPLLRDARLEREIVDQSDLTKIFTEEAVGFIEQNRAKPFFLYLPHAMVHTPLAASAAFRGKTGGGLYTDAVAEMDWSVGQILAALEKHDLARDTVIVFLSDNGGTARGVNTPLRGNKASVWEGGVRVPALFWNPGRVAVQVNDEVAHNMDILPTFAALAGVRPPRDRKIDGQDLTPLLTKAKGARSKHEALFHHQAGKLAAVRAGRWKLHANGELYDLAADIGESKNVAAGNPAVVKRLEAKLAEARADLGDGAPGPGCRPVGKAKGPLRFWIPRHPESGHPPQAPVHFVPGSPIAG